MQDKIEFILNPLSMRYIKKYGRLHNKLIGQGIMKSEFEKPRDKNIVFKVESTEEKEKDKEKLNIAKEVLNEKNENENINYVKGRGQYENAIVKQNKIMSKKDFVKKLTNIIYYILKDGDLISSLQEKNIEELENEILLIIT
jgi:hypothetical protein